MGNAKPAVLVAIVVALAVGWATRWEVVPASQGFVVYMVHRWTGEVVVVQGATLKSVRREP